MDKPTSNSTWAKRQSISIERYQSQTIHMLYASLITALSLKTATNSSHPKVTKLSMELQHPWHHTADTNH
ncbi:hypothetical protein [Absidia glauca]|uniref:Ndc10 domain-containing protein n=1 Tax=Absidia glauca TaxID=4829 RepID=A0A163KWX5_ABSGL|nr:hypothetical protein [Absidia glauca]